MARSPLMRWQLHGTGREASSGRHHRRITKTTASAPGESPVPDHHRGRRAVSHACAATTLSVPESRIVIDRTRTNCDRDVYSRSRCHGITIISGTVALNARRRYQSIFRGHRCRFHRVWWGGRGYLERMAVACVRSRARCFSGMRIPPGMAGGMMFFFSKDQQHQVIECVLSLQAASAGDLRRRRGVGLNLSWSA